MTDVRSILYIFLPCRPVYPLGVTYLADAVHQKHPDIRQQILDLSLIPPAHRRKTLENNLRDSYPNLKQNLSFLKIEGSRRSETLSVGEFARLANALMLK